MPPPRNRKKFAFPVFLLIACLCGCVPSILFLTDWKMEYEGPPFWERFLIPMVAHALGEIHAGPFNADQVAHNLKTSNHSLAVYKPPSSSPYAQVGPVYYLIGSSGERFLQTVIFPPRELGRVQRVAVLRTFDHRPSETPSGSGLSVPIPWADTGVANSCDLASDTSRKDRFPGKPYQTCLFWKAHGNYFLVYSVLSLEETASIIGSLERIR